MALARVVSFDGVSSDRMAEMAQEMEQGSPPDGMPPAELMILHDPGAERALAVIVFEHEDDYRKGDEILDAMPAPDTPGRRTSVAKYEVAVHRRI